MSEQLFLDASRDKWRFESDKGLLSVEQLWDLPLRSRSGFDLNAIAVAVNNDLRGLQEESFVEPRSDDGRKLLQSKLELVKIIIATKQAENQARVERAAKDQLKTKIREAIMAKKDQAISSASLEDLEAQLAALG
jgi:hypothetical protein